MIERARSDSAPTDPLAAGVAIVARGRTPEADVTALLELLVGAVGATRAAVFVWDAERDALAVAASTGFAEGGATELEAAVAADPGHAIARTAHDQAPLLELESGALGAAGVTATAPLRVAHEGLEEPLGAVAVIGEGAWRLLPEAAALVDAFADLIAIAVDRTRLVALATERADWAERVSHTDALTGLANARTLGRVLELEVARASRQGTDLSVILFDVDGLAATNDEAGPSAGDDILREVAAVLAESVRLVDTVARWGGDEFLAVAPGPAGMTVAQRVLDAVASRPAIGGRTYTVSAGVARFPNDGASPDELVAAAEAALVTAKQTGPGTLATAGRPEG